MTLGVAGGGTTINGSAFLEVHVQFPGSRAGGDRPRPLDDGGRGHVQFPHLAAPRSGYPLTPTAMRLSRCSPREVRRPSLSIPLPVSAMSGSASTTRRTCRPRISLRCRRRRYHHWAIGSYECIDVHTDGNPFGAEGSERWRLLRAGRGRLRRLLGWDGGRHPHHCSHASPGSTPKNSRVFKRAPTT